MDEKPHRLNLFYSNPEQFRESLYSKNKQKTPPPDLPERMDRQDRYKRHMQLAEDYSQKTEMSDIALSVYHYWRAMKLYAQAFEAFQGMIVKYPRREIIEGIGKLLSNRMICHENATKLLMEFMDPQTLAGSAFWFKGEPEKELASLVIHTIPCLEHKITLMIRAVGWGTTIEQNEADPLYILYHRTRIRFFGQGELSLMENMLAQYLNKKEHNAINIDNLD